MGQVDQVGTPMSSTSRSIRAEQKCPLRDRSAIELSDHFREVVHLQLDFVGETVAGSCPEAAEMFIGPTVFRAAVPRPCQVPRMEAVSEIG